MIGLGERLMSDEDNKASDNSNNDQDNVKKGDESHDNDSKGAADDKKSHAQDKDNTKSASTDNSFSADYVKKIRQEAKDHRTKANDLEKKLDDAKKEIDTLGKSALEKANKISTAIEKRLITAEINKIAREEGIVDVDAFKMVDLSKVTLSEEGEVVGLAPLVEELKTKKPYLFNKASSANAGAKAPVNTESDKSKPTYANDAEFKKAQAKLFDEFG